IQGSIEDLEYHLSAAGSLPALSRIVRASAHQGWPLLAVYLGWILSGSQRPSRRDSPCFIRRRQNMAKAACISRPAFPQLSTPGPDLARPDAGPGTPARSGLGT